MKYCHMQQLVGPRHYHIKSHRERQILYDITYVKSKKNNTKELNYKTEIVSKIQNCGYQREKVGRDKLGV